MIRFQCPACQKVLKVVDGGAGRKINCPKCGQRMLVPAPAQPTAANKTMLGQLTPSVSSTVPGPTPSASVESDNLVLLGLRKDAELEGRSGEQSGHKPARSWSGTLCALLALILAVAATPATVIHHPLLGAGLAAFGIVLALFAVFKSLFRRGLGLAAAALMVGGSVLFSIMALAGGPMGLLRPVTDRLVALHPQELKGRTEENSDRQTLSEKGEEEPKSEANQTEPIRAEREGQKEEKPNRQTRRLEKEEPPPKRTPKRSPQSKTELDRTIEQLKSEKAEECVAAAERLRKMGEKARPAARALCEAIVGTSESVRRSALEALEKIDPPLYKQVVLLVVDENTYNHVQASATLGAMGTEGEAAVPVLLSHAKKVSSAEYPNDAMLIADIAALAKLGPAESEVVKLFVEMTKLPQGRFGRGWQVRPAAINAIVATGNAQPARRKDLVQVLIAATEITVFGQIDEGTRLAAIKALGEFGTDAKAAIPALKNLKLSSSMRVREAARAALDKIEKDAEK